MATKKLNMAAIDSNAKKAEEAAQAYVRVSLSWTWPGASRAIKGSLREEIIDGLEAQASAVSASTRMWNWRQPALAAIAALKREIAAYWQKVTISWPEELGVRLLPKDKLDEFEDKMSGYQSELTRLAGEVQAQRSEIIERARTQRGRAFSEADYPVNLASLFAMTWGYSSLQVSEELKSISQTAYAAEKTRQTARVLGAVRLAEEQSIRQLHTLAGRLASRLEAVDADISEDEKRLPIFASMIESISEFCSQFSGVICWGCDDLDEVVRDAGGAVDGVSLEEIKADRELREAVAQKLAFAVGRLEAMLPALSDERPSGTRTAQGVAV